MNINPRFKLRDPASVEPTAIMLYLFANGRRFKYGTGLRIYPNLWHIPSNQKGKSLHEDARPTTTKSVISKYRSSNHHIDADLQSLSQKLERIKAIVSNHFQSDNSSAFDFKILRGRLDDFCKPDLNIVSERLDLNGYIEVFISGIEKGLRLIDTGPNKGKKYRPSTVKVYKEWKTQFFEFQGKHRYQFEDITIDFYDKYVGFFTSKGYKPNSIGKQVKILKVILRNAHDEGLHHNLEFSRKRFSSLKENTEAIYLTEVEIRKIFSLDLSESLELDLVRDVWLCGYWSAQRFSDYSRLGSSCFRNDAEGNLILDMATKKTGERIIIPVKPEFEETMAKYDFDLPKTYEQMVNNGIKEIGELAGINEMVTVKETKGGLEYSRQVPKCKLIMTHTARRSALTNLYLAGVPTIAIMKISGHRTEKSLMRYIKVTKEENASNLAHHPFFKTRMLKQVK